jgi:hypothetical protein
MQGRAKMLMLMRLSVSCALPANLFQPSVDLSSVRNSGSVSESAKYPGPTFYKSITAICELSKPMWSLKCSNRRSGLMSSCQPNITRRRPVRLLLLQAYVQYLPPLLLWSRFQTCYLSCLQAATVSESLKFLGPTLDSVRLSHIVIYLKYLKSSNQMSFFML